MRGDGGEWVGCTGCLFVATKYLHPFVPGEKAKWHQRVTHKHPVVSLLQDVENGPQGSDGGQST